VSQTLTSGFALSFWVLGGGVAALLAALLLVRSSEVAVEPEEARLGLELAQPSREAQETAAWSTAPLTIERQ
jgi:hypothetical protein